MKISLFHGISRLCHRMTVMDMAVEDVAGDITRVILRGRFDTTGAVVVELPFNKVATEKRAIMVDLSDVSFMSSYGIRVLLVGAKIVSSKGGKLVILCPDNYVAKVLKTAGMDALIPIFQSESAAAAALAIS
jgi:anti-anti-sigma factor